MLNRDECWAALMSRDRKADGAFVYAVRTTGVYCRPGCASRPPLPENVAFYATPAAAETADFCRCKRHRPTEAVVSRHVAPIKRACALTRPLDVLQSLTELADAAGIS